MPPVDDDELMRRAQAGDRDAFGVLVDRHKNALVRYLTMLTRSVDRAEDIAQEAFLRLYENRARYRSEGRFVAYLFRIATNVACSELRRQRRRRWLLALAGRSNGDAVAASPQDSLLRSEAAARVWDALEALPLHHRSPLILRDIEGWSYRDIAEALGCEEGTVKSRIHRGRERLRDRLAPYWTGEA